MSVILTSTTDTEDQISAALTAAGLTVDKEPAPEGDKQQETKPEDGAPPAAEGEKEAPAATEPPAKTEPESDPGKGQDKDTDKDGKRKLFKRIDALTAQRNKRDEKLAAAEKRIAELEAQGKPGTPPAEPPEPAAVDNGPKPPTRPRLPLLSDEGIGYDQDALETAQQKYEKDMTAYENEYASYVKDQAVREIEARRATEEEDRRIQDMYLKAREDYPDWDDVQAKVDDTAQIPQIAIAAAAKTKEFAGIIYHYATHAEEAKALMEMTPADILLEVGTVRARVMDAKNGRPSPEPPPPAAAAAAAPPPGVRQPPTTVQPAHSTVKPLTTLGGTAQSSQGSLEKAVANGDVKEYLRLRDAGVQR